jgi:hypothetical protein
VSSIEKGGTSEGTSVVIAVTAYTFRFFKQCQFHITQMSILYQLINGFAAKMYEGPDGKIDFPSGPLLDRIC